MTLKITPVIRKRPDHHIQVEAWINKANFHSYRARSYKFLGKLDEAYEDYLLASKILMEIIPRCSGYAALKNSEWQYHVTYADLVRVRSLILLCVLTVLMPTRRIMILRLKSSATLRQRSLETMRPLGLCPCPNFHSQNRILDVKYVSEG